MMKLHIEMNIASLIANVVCGGDVDADLRLHDSAADNRAEVLCIGDELNFFCGSGGERGTHCRPDPPTRGRLGANRRMTPS